MLAVEEGLLRRDSIDLHRVGSFYYLFRCGPPDHDELDHSFHFLLPEYIYFLSTSVRLEVE